MNERADRLLKALGNIGEDLIDKAAPVYPADSGAGGSVRKVATAIYEPEVKITKKDLRIYWITRALGMAAVAALIVGAVVLLVQNWDKIAVSGGERPGTIVKYIDELPDISEAYGKTIEFSDASVRFSSVAYDGTRLNTNFYLLYKGNDEFYSPALWINVEGAEHGDPSCGINPVMEADSYDYLIQSSVPVDLEPGKSYAINIVYKGSGNRENDTQKYRFNCPDIPVVTAVTTTNDPYLTSAVEPLIEPAEADTFEQITDTSMPEPFAVNENPTVYGGTDGWHDNFYDLWKKDFYAIDERLQELAGFERASEIIAGYKAEESADNEAGNITRYKLDDTQNRYRFIMDAGLSAEEVERALRGTDNTRGGMVDPDILVTFASKEETVKEHMTDYCIAVGEYVFSPKWLYYHTIEDYKAAGIDPYSMHSLLEKYSELGLSEEAWRAFRRKLILYAYSEMYPEKDRVYTYELDTSEPLGDDAFRIFEDMFCGEWEYAGKYDHHDASFDMTYGGTSFKFGRIFGIFETDEIYVIRYNDGGGVLMCFVIEKSSPDIMYNTDVLTSLGGIEEIKLGDDEWVKYINRKPAAAELKPGDLSIPGLTYLFHLYGSDFEDYYRAVIERDSYQSISEDENLYIGNGHILDDFWQYLVDMSENSVVLALPYVHDTQTAHQTPVYYELTFTKDESGEWSVTYNRSGEVYERADY
ncbi:MAG: hypothetical protein J6O50_08715 [Ruminiclostridium sp.]|nr:hypothetical protein [Ruminiclostridium sp.]